MPQRAAFWKGALWAEQMLRSEASELNDIIIIRFILRSIRFVTTERSCRQSCVPNSWVQLANRGIIYLYDNREPLNQGNVFFFHFELTPFSDGQLSKVSARPTVFNWNTYCLKYFVVPTIKLNIKISPTHTDAPFLYSRGHPFIRDVRQPKIVFDAIVVGRWSVFWFPFFMYTFICAHDIFPCLIIVVLTL